MKSLLLVAGATATLVSAAHHRSSLANRQQRWNLPKLPRHNEEGPTSLADFVSKLPRGGQYYDDYPDDNDDDRYNEYYGDNEGRYYDDDRPSVRIRSVLLCGFAIYIVPPI